ncbi:glycosyltransferase family 87 protein [Candidatus Omnitrophota bacterium]
MKHVEGQRLITLILLVILVFSLCGFAISGIFRSLFGFNVDFLPYYSAAQVFRQGGDMYDPDQIRQAELKNGLPRFEKIFSYQYPPLFTVLILPFTFFKYSLAKVFWLALNQIFVIGALFFIWASVIKKRSFTEVAFFLFLALNFYPLINNLNLGQINVLILFLICGAFYFFKKGNDIYCGIFLGLAAMFRITPALLIVYFLWRGQWRTFFWAVLSFVLLSLISLAIFGIDIHCYYLTEFLPSYLSSVPNQPANQSFTGFLFRLLDDGGLVDRVSAIFSFISLILVAFYCRYKKGLSRDSLRYDLEFCLVIITTLLISKVTWEHHLSWLLLPVAVVFWYFIENKFEKSKTFLIVLTAVAYAFLSLQFDYTEPRLNQGLTALAMAPRFYGAFILWCVVLCLLRIVGFRRERG